MNLHHLLLLLLATSALAQLRSSTWYSVIHIGPQFKIVEGKNVDESLAWGIYHDDTSVDGWGKLSLYSNTFSNPKVAMAAGFLEGALQGKYIGFVTFMIILSTKSTIMIKSSSPKSPHPRLLTSSTNNTSLQWNRL
jgi:hypothetical protein